MKTKDEKVTHEIYIPKNQGEIDEIEQLIKDIREEEAQEGFDLSELKKNNKPLLKK